MIGIMFQVSLIAIATLTELAAISRDVRLSSMTQMADEIRTLIADLFDDPEDFLKAPHPWFCERSPDELMATEAGQFLLLNVPSRRRSHAAR